MSDLQIPRNFVTNCAYNEKDVFSIEDWDLVVNGRHTVFLQIYYPETDEMLQVKLQREQVVDMFLWLEEWLQADEARE
jgi:hypothetical protein